MMELDSSDDGARCNLGMCIQQQLAIEIDYEKLPMLIFPLANRLIHRVSKPRSRS